jgi:hypothetical protein
LRSQGRAHEALQHRIADIVAQRCTEPGLCAEDVAQSLNIPVPLFHQALAVRGCGFAALLKHARTAAAGRRLSPEVRAESEGRQSP